MRPRESVQGKRRGKPMNPSDATPQVTLPEFTGMTCRCRNSETHDTLATAISDWIHHLKVWQGEEVRDPHWEKWVVDFSRDIPAATAEPHGEWEVGRNLDKFSADLTSDGRILRRISECPLALSTAFASFLEAHFSELPDCSIREAALWAVSTVFIEASWRAAAQHGTVDPFLAEQAATIAHARFLLLATPQRIPDGALCGLATLADGVFGDRFRFESVLRDARAVWMSVLNSHQTYPELGLANSKLEDEVDRLLFADADKKRLLATGGGSTARPDHSEADRRIQALAVDQHLLPRFQVSRVWRLDRADRAHPRWLWWLAMSAIALSIVCVALGIACPHHQAWSRPASVALASVALVAALVDSFRDRPVAAMKWMWRLPGAAVVGVLLLISLSRTWWAGLPLHPTDAYLASAVLLAASYGYLVLEARTHGVAVGNASLRALLVLAFASGHSYAVATLGLNLVGPVFIDGAVQLGADDVTSLGERLHDPTQYWQLLLLATCWCIAVGVFSQILWDDRPITAPLAHMRWMKGG